MSAPTEHTSTAISSRPLSVIWAQISDPSTWAAWNAAVASLELDGPFASGTEGRLTPHQGGELNFRLLDVKVRSHYVAETEIAATVSLVTTTRLAERPDGTVEVHQCSQLRGPAAEHFAPAFGDALVGGVERTVANLAASP